MQSAQFELHADIEERHWWFLARRRILRRIVAGVLPPGRGSTIIDVGCGTGANIAAFGNDYRCVGIDPSAEGVEMARRRFPQVQFVHGLAPDDLGPRMAEADLVLLTDVLEHIRDDFLFLSRLLAPMKPGAHLLLTVPADLALWSEHDVSFGHYRRYDADRLRQVWQGLPVKPRLVSYFNSRLYPLVHLSRAASRRRKRAAGAAGTDFWLPAQPFNRVLEEVFATEGRRLAGTLAGRRRAYRQGVSLVALLKRGEGQITPRTRPNHLAPDHFDPQTGRYTGGAFLGLAPL